MSCPAGFAAALWDMRHPLCALLLLLPLGCEADTGERPPAETPAASQDVEELCRGLRNTFACARRVEEARLAAGAAGVRRAGDSLILLREHGSPIIYADSVDEFGVGVRYSYQGRHPRFDWHLVHVQEYEGDGFLLVHSASGAEFPVDERPVYAPGGTRFATASYDLAAGYDPNALRILGIDADSVWLEWEVEPDDWGPVDPRWNSASTLAFIRRFPTEAGEHVDSAAVVTHTGEAWQIGTP